MSNATKLICAECGSPNLGWEAYVDENWEIVEIYDCVVCLDCEATEAKERVST